MAELQQGLQVVIRRTILSDLDAIATIDSLANISHPLVGMVFPSIEAGKSVFYGRFKFFLERPETHQFLTAVLVSDGGREEIVGFCVGSIPKAQRNNVGEKEWQPESLPEGTKMEVIGWYMAVLKEDREKYDTKKLWELQSISISPSYQRRGIGTQLLTAWLALVEKQGAREAGAYLQASKVGKGLYERFGWKDVGVMEVDFSQWGRKTTNSSWNMIRPGSGEGAQ